MGLLHDEFWVHRPQIKELLPSKIRFTNLLVFQVGENDAESTLGRKQPEEENSPHTDLTKIPGATEVVKHGGVKPCYRKEMGTYKLPVRAS